MNILLLGPQGSGKGTQAARLSAEYGLAHVATGDMLRSLSPDTELGQRVRPILDSGLLVPDDLVIELIRARLAEPDTEPGFVLDGFPRTMAQAEALDAMLREVGRELSVVFELRLPEGVALERLARRAHLEGRLDDTPEVIKTRLALYRQETEPLIEYYRTQGKLVPIHADRSINEVFAEIQRALDQVAVR